LAAAAIDITEEMTRLTHFGHQRHDFAVLHKA
jgi:hypothetical protein